MKYEIVVGLEIHAELNTRTKLFCACENAFGGEMNSRVCPTCLAYPGTLPRLNEQALRHAVLLGKAVRADIGRVSRFVRKQYFYPDLPAGYQITQYDEPVCRRGYLDYRANGAVRRCRLTRIQIEEDAAKLLHEEPDGTRIDFNRCGVPLLEIVTEPDLRGADEAKAFLEEVKSLLNTLRICDCKMEEGSLRCDVNVSVRPDGQEAFGTRVEMKNINTFSGVRRAVLYEAARQTEILAGGGAVSQETRRWNDGVGASVPMRSKEDARDYRYLPDPNLAPICLSDAYVDTVAVPELPMSKFLRYREAGLPAHDAGLLSEDRDRAAFFDACTVAGAPPKAASNWLLGDVAKELGARRLTLPESRLMPESLAALIALVETGVISVSAGKTALSDMFDSGRAPEESVKALRLSQMNDKPALEALAREVIARHPKPVADYRSGKTAARGFLVGQCMKDSGGKANPERLGEILENLLK